MTQVTGMRHGFRAARALVAEMARTSPIKSALGAVLLVVLTLADGAGLLLLAPLLELVGVVEENPLPRAAGWLESGLSVVGLKPALGSVLLLFVAIAGTRTLVQRLQARLTASVREEMTNDCRIRVYRAMAAAEWRYLVTRSPSEFAHTLTNEVGRVGLAVSQITELAVAIAVSTVYLGLALRLSPALAVLVTGTAAVLAWIVRSALGRSRGAGTRAAAARSRLHAAIAEHVASVKTARSYGAVDRQAREFTELSRASRDVGLEVSVGETDLQQSLELGSTVLLALLVYVAMTIIHVSPSLLLILLFIFARLMPRMVNIYRLLQGLAIALPVVEAVNRLERECRAAAQPYGQEQREVALATAIQFEDVSFAYLRREGVPVVAGFNLRIAAGMTTAIVGPSGSGKSTVADLLMGLLSPTTGRILIDGEPLTASAYSSWRRQISYLPQDTFLFHDTVRANLVWVRADATEPEVWEVLRLAAADRFVKQLPHGLDTVVGERGVLISGGERQRLSIARALLRRPRILILDEATSSIDGENEVRIQQAIDALRHRLTIVIITHRLSTIRHADVIHMMEGGQVVRSGTWDELSAWNHGRFADSAESIAGGER